MLQKMPVTQIRPLLTLPIRRGQIVSFSLSKTLYSFFNWSHFFMLLPLTFFLLKDGYAPEGVLAWVAAIVGCLYANNFLNILANNSDRVFYPFLGLMAALGITQYYGWFDLRPYSQWIFDRFYNQPVHGLEPIALAVLLYLLTFAFFRGRLYLDGFLKPKATKMRSQNLGWLDGFGELGMFLKNDIRLITRNKRARVTVITAAIFLLYGLLFFTGAVEIYEGPYWGLFAGIFVTGGFTFTFGQFIPSWDSSYYPFMMTQNIPYRTYLNAKWWLIVIATGLSIVLSLPYAYFGTPALLAVITAGIFNLGVNSHLVMWGGAYVKTPIDLSAATKAFGDSKSFNAKTLLLTIPKLFLPMGLYYLGSLTGQDYVGYGFVAGAGLLGFLFKGQVFNLVERIYFKEKYATIKAYKDE